MFFFAQSRFAHRKRNVERQSKVGHTHQPKQSAPQLVWPDSVLIWNSQRLSNNKPNPACRTQYMETRVFFSCVKFWKHLRIQANLHVHIGSGRTRIRIELNIRRQLVGESSAEIEYDSSILVLPPTKLYGFRHMWWIYLWAIYKHKAHTVWCVCHSDVCFCGWPYGRYYGECLVYSEMESAKKPRIRFVEAGKWYIYYFWTRAECVGSIGDWDGEANYILSMIYLIEYLFGYFLCAG